MDISLDAVRARRSVRSYDGSALGSAQEAAIRAAIGEAVPGPFGGRPRFELFGPGLGSFEKGKIGTYGVISRAQAFIIGAVERASFAMEDFGYCLEGILLRATELGLGSCWLGGIFDRGAAGKALGIGPKDLVPACSPLGVPADRQSIQERIIRFSAGSRARKPASELFFEERGGVWQALEQPGIWAEVLEAVRVGPSASNKQPWRILVSERAGRPELDLFLEEDRRYNSMLGEIKLQDMDMGIAMRHVEVAARAQGIGGAWLRHAPETIKAAAPRRYICSWIAK